MAEQNSIMARSVIAALPLVSMRLVIDDRAPPPPTVRAPASPDALPANFGRTGTRRKDRVKPVDVEGNVRWAIAHNLLHASNGFLQAIAEQLFSMDHGHAAVV